MLKKFTTFCVILLVHLAFSLCNAKCYKNAKCNKILNHSILPFSNILTAFVTDIKNAKCNEILNYSILSIFGHENISTAILPLPLIQEEHLSVNGEKMCA